MMFQQSIINVFISIFVINQCLAYFKIDNQDDCFCQLSGKIDECTCNIDTVDHFNNVKIYPRLKSLLLKDYFRFYKVNLKRQCPFWSDDSKCAMRFCHVEACSADEIPQGMKDTERVNGSPKSHSESKFDKYSKEQNEDCTSHHSELDYLNKTLSEKTQKDMQLWDAYDDALDNFCDIDENDEEAEYVDLLLNPERYTGLWKVTIPKNDVKK